FPFLPFVLFVDSLLLHARMTRLPHIPARPFVYPLRVRPPPSFSASSVASTFSLTRMSVWLVFIVFNALPPPALTQSEPRNFSLDQYCTKLHHPGKEGPMTLKEPVRKDAAQIVRQLSEQLRRWEEKPVSRPAAVVSSGVEALDGLLAERGYRRGTLVE